MAGISLSLVCSYLHTYIYAVCGSLLDTIVYNKKTWWYLYSVRFPCLVSDLLLVIQVHTLTRRIALVQLFSCISYVASSHSVHGLIIHSLYLLLKFSAVNRPTTNRRLIDRQPAELPPGPNEKLVDRPIKKVLVN